MDVDPDVPRGSGPEEGAEGAPGAADRSAEGASQPGAAAQEMVALEGFVEAWAEADDLARRRELERCIAELLRIPLAERARAELYRLRERSGTASVEDVVNQTVVELPTILASYVEGDPPSPRKGPAGFHGYALNATRNVARDLVKRSRRERERLARMAASHPSRLPRVPTTPSQREIRVEIRALLARELERFGEADQAILRRRAAGASFAELARELGMPASTVRYRYHLCSARLRRVVERALGGDPFDE